MTVMRSAARLPRHGPPLGRLKGVCVDLRHAPEAQYVSGTVCAAPAGPGRMCAFELVRRPSSVYASCAHPVCVRRVCALGVFACSCLLCAGRD